MKILNFFYENPPHLENNYKRKIQLDFQNTLIKGPKHCGKKSLILNFLSSFKNEEILFLPMEDPRFELSSLQYLDIFIQQNPQIKILCLCDYKDFYPLPKCNITTLITTENKSLTIHHFKELFLDYLDFEEFISLSKKNLPINNLVGLFLQHGRSKFGTHSFLLKNCFSLLELEILKYLALNLGQQISISKMFFALKQKFKTSKDSVYQSIKKLENISIIHPINHDTKKIQKFYFRDFGMRNALCIQKDFQHLFENLILNELFKNEKNLIYNKFFNFYSIDSKSAYISSPILDIDLIKLRAKKILPKAIELHINHIFFITLSNEYVFFDQGVKFEILPFDKWALGF